jgi:hypothetical protein
LRRLVLELAVVHDLANRWFGIRGNFDKVEIGVRGDAKSVFDTHNAHLLPSWSDQADFRYADAFVDAGLSADGASLGLPARLHRWAVLFQATATQVSLESASEITPSAKKPC